MIGHLRGVVSRISGQQMILDVGGVGYLVSCSAHSLRLCGGEGEEASLWVETIVREDAINLFGFVEESEKDAFRLLTTVQGVGAKAALAILSVLSPESLSQAIVSQDKKALTVADGVGPKLALRIVTELKDKVANVIAPALPGKGGAAPAGPLPEGGVAEDALSALINLGYKRMEAFAAISQVLAQNEGEFPLNDVIRGALAQLGRKDR